MQSNEWEKNLLFSENLNCNFSHNCCFWFDFFNLPKIRPQYLESEEEDEEDEDNEKDDKEQNKMELDGDFKLPIPEVQNPNEPESVQGNSYVTGGIELHQNQMRSEHLGKTKSRNEEKESVLFELNL